MKLPLFDQLSLFRAPTAPTLPAENRRRILLGNRIVDYTLRQAPRRRLALNIDDRGLRVGAPRTIAIADIEQFIRDNTQWVLGKLDEYAAKPSRKISIRDGESLPVLGAEVRLCIVPGANRIQWQDDALVLAARANADLEALARRALQRRAQEVFLERIDCFRPHIVRPIPPLSLSSARTRWGSCSRDGIRLNWRLIHLPLPVVDYVVAHELAHLEQMNHSPRFWAVVERLYPDYRMARNELKQRAVGMPIL